MKKFLTETAPMPNLAKYPQIAKFLLSESLPQNHKNARGARQKLEEIKRLIVRCHDLSAALKNHDIPENEPIKKNGNFQHADTLGHEGGSFHTESGSRIFLGRSLRMVNPALAYVDGKVMIIRPFPTEKVVFDKKGEIVGMRPTIENFVVTSEGKVLDCRDNVFNEMDLIPQFPSGVIEERWSKDSVKAFIDSLSKGSSKENQCFTLFFSKDLHASYYLIIKGNSEC